MQTAQDKHALQEEYAIAGETIPIIDLGPFLAEEPGAAHTTAREMRDALERIGFFFIINHGIPTSLRDRLVEATARFYALPLEQKMALKVNEEGNGYVPTRGELPKTSPYYTGTRKPDVSECYLLQRDWGPSHRPTQNQWPENGSGFRPTVMEFFEAAEDLSIRMLPLYALALDLEPDFFDDKFPKCQGLNFLRVARMPPDRLDEDEFNVGPHTDSSFITLLATSDQPGLEILSQSGRWLKMPLIPDAFVINSGDMLTRWSNGRVLSTPHRVINASDTYRYSIPFFLHPTPETVIECLPTCCGPENPAKEPPITSAAYLQWFLEENFALGDQVYNEAGEQVTVAETI